MTHDRPYYIHSAVLCAVCADRVRLDGPSGAGEGVLLLRDQDGGDGRGSAHPAHGRGRRAACHHRADHRDLRLRAHVPRGRGGPDPGAGGLGARAAAGSPRGQLPGGLLSLVCAARGAAPVGANVELLGKM
eukprot:SAG25_NODE_1062_length_4147_cov_2.881670_2_plen_131_part_00